MIARTKQLKLTEGLQQLLELNFDAIEAYEAAISKVSNCKYKTQLLKFKADHERHIHNISRFIRCSQSLYDKSFIEASQKNSQSIEGLFKRVKEFCQRVLRKKDIVSKFYSEDVELLINNNLRDEMRHALWFKLHEKELVNYSINYPRKINYSRKAA